MMFGAYKSRYIKLVQLAMDTIITQFRRLTIILSVLKMLNYFRGQ